MGREHEVVAFLEKHHGIIADEQISQAFSTIAVKTGPTSVGDEAITFSTSPVAVCC